MKNKLGRRERKRKGERDCDFYRKTNCFFCFSFGRSKQTQSVFPDFVFCIYFFFFLPSPPPPLLPLLIGLLLPLCPNDLFFLLIFVCSSFKVNLKVHLQELARRLASGAGGGGSGSLTKKTTTTAEKQEKFSPFLRARSRPPRQSL